MELGEVQGATSKEIQDNMTIVKASDPVPELRGNKLPRIVDYDMMETSTLIF